MRFLTTRRILGVLAALAVVAVLGVVWRAQIDNDPPFLQVDDLAGDDLPLGELVSLGGRVVSFEGGTMVLKALDSEQPRVLVEFERTVDEAIGIGAVVIVEGRLERPDLVKRAEFVAQQVTGPYEAEEPDL